MESQKNIEKRRPHFGLSCLQTVLKTSILAGAISRSGGIFQRSGGFLEVCGGFLKFFFDLTKFRAFALLVASIPLYLNLKCGFIAFLLIIFSLFYKYNNEN